MEGHCRTKRSMKNLATTWNELQNHCNSRAMSQWAFKAMITDLPVHFTWNSAPPPRNPATGPSADQSALCGLSFVERMELLKEGGDEKGGHKEGGHEEGGHEEGGHKAAMKRRREEDDGRVSPPKNLVDY
ncbi:hypothetical protein EYF80_047374 [Liparis tanakae]|uniref:Uncharacterized protein n=1 Tax=Liparis tanakae TaxID=230148 RepID=A0A4Z2FNL7_9TELE|nr:hypothetical protein EYF80_047374 [Liparis tanakae]